MIKIPIDTNNGKEESICKGLVFRCTVSSFLSSHNSIEIKKSFRLLKRKSCSGCEKCEWIWDHIQADMDHKHDYLGGLQDQEIYKLEATWSPGPYEYPNDGDMEIEFIKVPGVQ